MGESGTSDQQEKPPPKAQPPRKRSGQRTVWTLKRWKAGDLVKRPADGVSDATHDGLYLVNLSGPKGQLVAPIGLMAYL